MSNKCRTCLRESNESIFKQVSFGGNQISLVVMLKLCTGIEVTQSDKISLCICDNCTENIIKIYLYRQTCWNSQTYLLNELKNKLNVINPPTREVSVKCEVVLKEETGKVNLKDINEDNMEEPTNLITYLTKTVRGVAAPSTNSKKCIMEQNYDKGQAANSEHSSFIRKPDCSLKELEQNDNAKECKDSNATKIYTKTHALYTFCEFIRTPKLGSSGKWKCRKCGNLNIRTLRMLQHLFKAHGIRIKLPKVYIRKQLHSATEKIENLTSGLTKYQALSTYTYYPYLDQVDSHFPRTTQECRDCGYTNNVPRQMIYHLRNSHNIKISDVDDFKCTRCDVKCRSYYFLLLHEKSHDEPIELPLSGLARRIYECSTCDSKFETKFNLDQHMKLHLRKPNIIIPKRKAYRKSTLCELCGEIFSSPQLLKNHVRSHTGEKPFNCKLCEFSAAHYATMYAHMRKHAGIRPFKCDLCDKTYSNSTVLKIHRRAQHTNEMPYECKICSKKYKLKSSYKLHIRTHDPDTYLTCTYCDKKFRTKFNLNLHKKQHTGEKPHACDLCDKQFIQRKSLRLHVKNHHQKIVN